jgi:hypothetical protein
MEQGLKQFLAAVTNIRYQILICQKLLFQFSNATADATAT